MAERDPIDDLGDYIAGSIAEHIVTSGTWRGELTVEVMPERILKVLTFLRNDANCQFKTLIDVCGVDYPGREARFDVVYHLLSLTHNTRVRIKAAVSESQSFPSATSLFSSAAWFEREAWDLYGIHFSEHPDLRRLLTDYGFEGHPLRKDFPLTGYVEIRYDEEQKRVIYEPVKLVQEFRDFDFLSPWEGAPPVLPGDEKADEA